MRRHLTSFLTSLALLGLVVLGAGCAASSDTGGGGDATGISGTAGSEQQPLRRDAAQAQVPGDSMSKRTDGAKAGTGLTPDVPDERATKSTDGGCGYGPVDIPCDSGGGVNHGTPTPLDPNPAGPLDEDENRDENNC